MINGIENPVHEKTGPKNSAEPDVCGPNERISSTASISSMTSWVTSIELENAMNENSDLNDAVDTTDSTFTVRTHKPSYESVVPTETLQLGDTNPVPVDVPTNLMTSHHQPTNDSSCFRGNHICYPERTSVHNVSAYPRNARSNSISSEPEECSEAIVDDSRMIQSMHEQDSDDQVDKVKNKIISMWNNMKYGWTVKMKTNFRYDSPIWLLGNCYHKKMDDEEIQTHPRGERHHSLIHGFNHFKGDFFSRLWFTYRKEFPVLAGSSLTTDCGWGCMLRSGQMMLAQGFLMHYLGRHWNWHNRQSTEFVEMHRSIIRWFGDVPSNQSPFSIHQLVSLGESSGIKAGEWYGPASVAHIFKRAMDMAHKHDPLTQQVCVYVSQDCTVYKEDLIKLCSSHPSNKWQGVIIFVPVRLGGEKLNPIYNPCVRAILAHESCIGIIGGRPRHSLYFIGWQEESLIYLDPHYCQPVVDVLTDDFPVESFHCMSPRKLSISKMDPSCTIGFYCKTENDLMFFLSTIKDVLVPPKQKADYPIFIVSEGSVADTQKLNGEETLGNLMPQKDRLLKFTHTYINKNDETEHVVEGEEFVVL